MRIYDIITKKKQGEELTEEEIRFAIEGFTTVILIMLLLGGCIIGVPVAIVATGFEDMIAEQAGEEPDEDADIYETLKKYDSLPDDQKKRFLRLIETDQSDEEST